MSIQLIIDSASDFGYEAALRCGLYYLPMRVMFGEEEYRDGIDLSHAAFFEKLQGASALPTTSQISPFEFEQVFRQIVQQGDTAVAITISSKLSGTYQSACTAAADFPGKAFVVDSLNACVGELLLIRYAIKLIQAGTEAQALIGALEAQKKRIRVLARLDTLEYLKKGGRISPMVAFAGSVLSIKPVICIEDGAVALLGKARGSKNGNNLLTEYVTKSGGIDFSMPYSLAFSGSDDRALHTYIEDSKALWQGHIETLPICTIGSTIGTHVGPGALAVSFFAKR